MTPTAPSHKSSPHPDAFQRLIDRLRNAKRVAIFSHQRPDPDAMGSQAAAACILQHLGAKQMLLMHFAEPPAPYRFLQQGVPGEVVMFNATWAAGPGADVDTILVVDTCTYQQLEPAQAYLKAQHAKVAGIDHHLSREPIGQAEFLYADTSSAACVEILWQIAHAVNCHIAPQIALPLMAGLVGDTGWFRFDSVTPRTHLMAADLAPHVDPSELYEQLMQNESRPKLALMQRALASTRWSVGDRFACMILKNTDFQEAGANQSQTEYLVDMPMMISTVEVVALMSELPDGRIRVSLRSKHAIDVNHICNQFGGGGHAKAAGCRLDAPLEAAYEKLAQAVGKSIAG